MANKFLRRLLRSGLFFPPSIETHEAVSAASAAANKLYSMEGLSHYPWDMQGPPVRSVRSSHFSCVPLHASLICLPSSSATYSSANKGSNYEEEDKQFARSHSFSKLQGKQLVPAFKSLMRRPAASSHGHLHNRQSRSCKLHHFAAESSSRSASSYTRTWSSPSLKLSAARSFSVSQSKDGRRAGKCAPKGHVAVYVEAGRERRVVPIASLSHPQFRELLERAEREYGYAGQQGPGLRIPCSLSELHHALHRIRTHPSPC